MKNSGQSSSNLTAPLPDSLKDAGTIDKEAQDKQAAEVKADLVNAMKTDEFAGKGGSYIFDPITKTRTLAPAEE